MSKTNGFHLTTHEQPRFVERERGGYLRFATPTGPLFVPDDMRPIIMQNPQGGLGSFIAFQSMNVAYVAPVAPADAFAQYRRAIDSPEPTEGAPTA